MFTMKLLINYALFLILIIFALNTRSIYAVSTKLWVETDYSDFTKGQFENVSSHSKGEVSLSPEIRKIEEIPAVYVWCLATNEMGQIFAGAGDPGSIFKITQDGDSIELYKTPELHVQTIAIDNDGYIYAGTIPHGTIYKISPDGKGEVFCKFPDPYIWDMVLDTNGNLYAATGSNGVIYKITKDGAVSVYFDTPYSNILDIVIDNDNNIYAACEPEGLICKITASGNISVIYDAKEDEIHCLAIDKNGTLYAGTSSGIPPALPVPALPRPSQIQLPPPIEEFPYEASNYLLYDTISNSNSDDFRHAPAKEDFDEKETRQKPVTAKKNSVYKIDIEGRVREIFTIERAFILCLSIDSNNDIFVGTGNRAKIFKINNKEEISLLYDFHESQILDILSYKDNVKYIATGNNANIYKLSGKYSAEGVYESAVHDATFVSSWGSITWKGKSTLLTGTRLSSRSGNCDKQDTTWSDWSSEYQHSGKKIKSPSARFIQYRATLTTKNPTITPTLDDVCIAYLPQNQPPLITNIYIDTPNDPYTDKPDSNNKSSTSKAHIYTPEQLMSGLAAQLNGQMNSKNEMKCPESTTREPQKLISWNAEDPNGDRLQFDMEYKSVDEIKWTELIRNVKVEKKYYWNTNRIPDGHYQVKVTANDIPDNPAELSLKEEKVSNAFLIDNTNPFITELKKSTEPHQTGSTLTISGVVKDEMCNISEIQYSIDSGDWHTVFPIDMIFDSKYTSLTINLNLCFRRTYRRNQCNRRRRQCRQQ